METLRAFFMIFMAEMGDKTQILAMAFATQFAVIEILTGVTIGSFLNHGLAIILGQLLSQWLDLNLLQFVAGVAFVGFAFWSLSIDEDEEEEVKSSKYGPVATVALAFFIGELGDKTQLTALTLGSVSEMPFLTLIGTTLGMVATSYIGIFVGKRLGKAVPELVMKTGAACIFIFFGFEKLLFNNNYISTPIMIGILGSTALLFLYILRNFQIQYRAIEESKYKHLAGTLKAYYTALEGNFEVLCLGIETCGTCDGKACAVGYMKDLMNDVDKLGEFNEEMVLNFLKKDHDMQTAEDVYWSIIGFYDKHEASFDDEVLHRVRHVLEGMLFKRYIEGQSISDYKKNLEKIRENN